MYSPRPLIVTEPYDAKICQNILKQSASRRCKTLARTTAAPSCLIENEAGEFVCTIWVKEGSEGRVPRRFVSLLISTALA